MMSGPIALVSEYGELCSEEEHLYETDDELFYHEQPLYSDDELLQERYDDFEYTETPDEKRREDATPEDIQEEEKQQLQLNGSLKGHGGWVTQIAASPADPNMILSSSRDKSVIMWQLERDEEQGRMVERSKTVLRGHSHFVSDVQCNSKGQFALSGSWDKDLRLWDLEMGKSVTRFTGHSKDVLSVSFSEDDRQICSGSRDKTIRLWNTRGDHKFTFEDDCHTEWVSCIRFSPCKRDPTIVSGGWDRVVKVWDLQTCTLKTNLHGHSGYINCVEISPDGALCASGGKDGLVHLWALHLEDTEAESFQFTLDNQEEVYALCYNPIRLWISVAAGTSIKVWNLETRALLYELSQSVIGESKKPMCTCLAWSQDGQTLYAGYTDNVIRVWEICLLKKQTFDSYIGTEGNNVPSVPTLTKLEGV